MKFGETTCLNKLNHLRSFNLPCRDHSFTEIFKRRIWSVLDNLSCHFISDAIDCFNRIDNSVMFLIWNESEVHGVNQRQGNIFPSLLHIRNCCGYFAVIRRFVIFYLLIRSCVYNQTCRIPINNWVMVSKI